MVFSELMNRRALQIPATLATIAVMLALPPLVHLLPPVGGVAPGPALLPIYYAPLIAAALFHPAVAIIASIAAPGLNFLLTGSPPQNIALILSIELTIFSLLALYLWRRRPSFWGAGLVAYLGAKAIMLPLLFVLPLAPGPVIPFIGQAIAQAWPGLIILLAIGWLIVRSRQRHAP